MVQDGRVAASGGSRQVVHTCCCSGVFAALTRLHPPASQMHSSSRKGRAQPECGQPAQAGPGRRRAAEAMVAGRSLDIAGRVVTVLRLNIGGMAQLAVLEAGGGGLLCKDWPPLRRLTYQDWKQKEAPRL